MWIFSLLSLVLLFQNPAPAIGQGCDVTLTEAQIAEVSSRLFPEGFIPDLKIDFDEPKFLGFDSNMPQKFKSAYVKSRMLHADIQLGGLPKKWNYEKAVKQWPEKKEILDAYGMEWYREESNMIGHTHYYKVSSHTRLNSVETAVIAYQTALQIQKMAEKTSGVYLAKLLRRPRKLELAKANYEKSLQEAAGATWVASAYFPIVNGLESGYLHILDGKIVRNEAYDPEKDAKKIKEVGALKLLLQLSLTDSRN